jgi:hypothetical protein
MPGIAEPNGLEKHLTGIALQRSLSPIIGVADQGGLNELNWGGAGPIVSGIGTPATILWVPDGLYASGSPATSPATNGATSGNLIIAVVGSDVSAGDYVRAFTDSAGNTYALAGHSAGGTSYFNVSIFYCVNNPNPIVAGTTTFTATTNAGGNTYGMSVWSVSGCNGGLDISVPSTVNGTSLSTSTGTLSVINEIVIAAIETSGVISGFVEDTKFTRPNATGSYFNVSYDIVSSTNSVSYAPSWTGSLFVGAVLASFKITGSGGPISGTFVLNDQSDSAALVGSALSSGAAILTDQKDTVAIVGALAGAALSTSFALTDQKDTAANVGTVKVSGTSPLTDQVDTSSIAGTVTSTATGVVGKAQAALATRTGSLPVSVSTWAPTIVVNTTATDDAGTNPSPQIGASPAWIPAMDSRLNFSFPGLYVQQVTSGGYIGSHNTFGVANPVTGTVQPWWTLNNYDNGSGAPYSNPPATFDFQVSNCTGFAWYQSGNGQLYMLIDGVPATQYFIPTYCNGAYSWAQYWVNFTFPAGFSSGTHRIQFYCQGYFAGVSGFAFSNGTTVSAYDNSADLNINFMTDSYGTYPGQFGGQGIPNFIAVQSGTVKSFTSCVGGTGYNASPGIFVATVTFSASTTISSTGIGLTSSWNGSWCQFFSTGTLPSPLVQGAYYWFVSAGTNSFTVSATPTGSAVSMAGAGTGTHTAVMNANPNQGGYTNNVERLGVANLPYNMNGYGNSPNVAPDIHIAMSGINDPNSSAISGGGSYYGGATYAANCRANWPNAILVITGPWDPDGTTAITGQGGGKDFQNFIPAWQTIMAGIAGPWVIIDDLQNIWYNSGGQSGTVNGSHGTPWITGSGSDIALTAVNGTSATMAGGATWNGTTGTYTLEFNDGSTKSATLTNGSGTVTWSGAITKPATIGNFLVPHDPGTSPWDYTSFVWTPVSYVNVGVLDSGSSLSGMGSVYGTACLYQSSLTYPHPNTWAGIDYHAQQTFQNMRAGILALPTSGSVNPGAFGLIEKNDSSSIAGKVAVSGTAVLADRRDTLSGVGSVGGALQYYVAKTGSDSANGSSGTPWLTISHATSAVSTSGATINVAAGTYTERVSMTHAGVTLSGASGAIIDGTGVTSTNNPLVNVSASNCVVTGFEVRNSADAGISVNAFNNCTISNNVAHTNIQQGIIVAGTTGTPSACQNNIISGNTAYDNDRSNAGLNQNGGWGNGITAADCLNCQIINNTSYHNFGEAIGTFRSQGTIIKGNVAYDSVSVGIYCDNAPGCIVDGNLIYYTGTTTAYNMNGTRMDGLMSAIEVYGGYTKQPFLNCVWKNNIIVGTRYGIYYGTFGTTGGWQNGVVSGNTVYGVSADAYFMNSDAGHSNNVFVGNLMDSSSLAQTIPSSGWTFNHNCWYTPPSFLPNQISSLTGWWDFSGRHSTLTLSGSNITDITDGSGVIGHAYSDASLTPPTLATAVSPTGLNAAYSRAPGGTGQLRIRPANSPLDYTTTPYTVACVFRRDISQGGNTVKTIYCCTMGHAMDLANYTSGGHTFIPNWNPGTAGSSGSGLFALRGAGEGTSGTNSHFADGYSWGSYSVANQQDSNNWHTFVIGSNTINGSNPNSTGLLFMFDGTQYSLNPNVADGTGGGSNWGEQYIAKFTQILTSDMNNGTNGWTGELLVFNSLLTLSQGQQVSTYLNNEWITGGSSGGTVPAAVKGTGDVYSNPLLTNPGTFTAAGYVLQSGSPCIGACPLQSSVTTNYSGATRTNPTNIGAM